MKNLFFVSLCLLSSLLAAAQTDTIVTRLHEIAVVGIKQSAVPDLSAVSVIGAKEAERLNIVTMRNASDLVPNFYMPDYGSRMTSSIYVRGLGARIDQPVVGLNIDNVPYLNKDSYDFDIFDIENVEVLRGAQSILNGRNTMLGQVNISTLSPWHFQGWKAMAEYASANSVKSGLGYYTKLHDNLATSLSGYFTHSDGFFRNGYNNGRLDRENQGSLRYKVSWHPSSRLSLTNVASGQLSRQGGYPYVSVATGELAYNDTCFYRRNSFADGLTVGWTGKRVIVTSVTSLQYIDDNMTLDQDFTPKEYFTLSQMRKEYSITEDLYAKGSRGGLSWLSGVFGFYKNTDMDAPVTFKNDGITNLIEKHPNEMNPSYPVEWDQRNFVLGSNFTYITKGAALYGQASYSLDKWLLQAGLRLDVEHASLGYLSHCNTAYTTYHILPDGSREVYSHNPIDINEHGHLKRTFVQLLPKVAVGYNFSRYIKVYANVAKGYKAGGFNTQMFSDVLQQQLMEIMGVTKKYDIDEIVSYKPEKSWNFEVGSNLSLLDARLTLDATAFYISCVDQQLTAFPDGLTTGRIMTNAGRTRSYGVEIAASYSLMSSLSLRASYGYTNAKFRVYDNGKADFSGNRLPYAPANTAFLSAYYRLPFSFAGITPSIEVNLRGVGDIYWDDENSVKQPFYTTAGVAIGVESAHWSLRLWGENITDTKYDTFYFVSMSNAFVQRARPAVYGATLRFNL